MPVKKKRNFTRSPFKIFKLNNHPLNVQFYRFLKFFKGACQLMKHYYFFIFNHKNEPLPCHLVISVLTSILSVAVLKICMSTFGPYDQEKCTKSYDYISFNTLLKKFLTDLVFQQQYGMAS